MLRFLSIVYGFGEVACEFSSAFFLPDNELCKKLVYSFFGKEIIFLVRKNWFIVCGL